MNKSSKWCKDFCANNPIPSPLRRAKVEGEPDIVTSKPAKPGKDGYGETTPVGTRTGISSTGDEYSLPPDASTIKGKLQAIMDKPYKPGQGFKLPNINPKPAAIGGTAGLVGGWLKETSNVKDAKVNLSTAQSNVQASQADYDRASSTREISQNLYDNYCTQGLNGLICTPTADAIQAGTLPVGYFDTASQIQQGYIPQAPSGTPWDMSNAWSSDKIDQSISTHQENLSNQTKAEGILKSAKTKRYGSAAFNGLLGMFSGIVADKAIGAIKKKIQEKKIEKQKPKHDW